MTNIPPPSFEDAENAEPIQSLNKDEWIEVCKMLDPGKTIEEYEKAWDDFQTWKANEIRKRGLQ